MSINCAPFFFLSLNKTFCIICVRSRIYLKITRNNRNWVTVFKRDELSPIFLTIWRARMEWIPDTGLFLKLGTDNYRWSEKMVINSFGFIVQTSIVHELHYGTRSLVGEFCSAGIKGKKRRKWSGRKIRKVSAGVRMRLPWRNCSVLPGAADRRRASKGPLHEAAVRNSFVSARGKIDRPVS